MENNDWKEVVHVASSLVPKVNQYSMFVGKFWNYESNDNTRYLFCRVWSWRWI